MLTSQGPSYCMALRIHVQWCHIKIFICMVDSTCKSDSFSVCTQIHWSPIWGTSSRSSASSDARSRRIMFPEQMQWRATSVMSAPAGFEIPDPRQRSFVLQCTLCMVHCIHCTAYAFLRTLNFARRIDGSISVPLVLSLFSISESLPLSLKFFSFHSGVISLLISPACRETKF